MALGGHISAPPCSSLPLISHHVKANGRTWKQMNELSLSTSVCVDNIDTGTG
jgi:hypothetical protein